MSGTICPFCWAERSSDDSPGLGCVCGLLFVGLVILAASGSFWGWVCLGVAAYLFFRSIAKGM
jgi:hypothetical protein